jgi:small nuclear ribonucleoprotein (snRNP)-like protein
MSSNKEKAISFKTLFGFLGGLVGHRVLLELRNETQVSGILVRVDVQMNVQMEQVKMRRPNDFWYSSFTEQLLDYIYIKGNKLRYVRFDQSINPGQVLRRQMNQMNPKQTTVKSIKRQENLQKFAKKATMVSDPSEPGPSK